MPEALDPDFIDETQYDQYKKDWLELISSDNPAALQNAFQAANGARLNFLTFSIDQILALVSADGAHLIKARFLYMPDANEQLRFSATLFTVDANDHPLTAYYIPTQTAATTAQAVDGSDEESTQITPAVALGLLTNWVEAKSLTTKMFTTSHGPMHGYNFEVSTFEDPLAGAQPYDDKSLFLNCGLSTETEATQIVLVDYVGLMGSRTQGSLEGIPDDGSFYDKGDPCPPSP